MGKFSEFLFSFYCRSFISYPYPKAFIFLGKRESKHFISVGHTHTNHNDIDLPTSRSVTFELFFILAESYVVVVQPSSAANRSICIELQDSFDNRFFVADKPSKGVLPKTGKYTIPV
jgi:hypothetical protein